MIGRRRGLAAIGLVTAAVVLGGLVLLRLPTDGPQPSPSRGPTTSGAPPTPAPDDATVRAYPGTPLLPGPPVEPVGRATQSRLWAVDGIWYGIAVDPGTRESRISVLSADGSRWTDTGVRVDERPGAMVDAVWDGTRLVTASAVPGRSTDNGLRVSRFGRDETGRFVRDPNFPVPVTERGVGAATIARDGSGRLWVAFVQDGAALVAHSLADDAIWSAPAAVPGSGTVGEDDLAAVVATGDGRLAIAWSDTPGSAVRVVVRSDETSPETWSPPEEAFAGLPLAARPISVAGADGTVAIGIQTTAAPGEETGANDPDSLIAVRDPDGGWRTALTSRVGDRLGSPVVVLDAGTDAVYAFLTSPRRAGRVYLKRSPLDRLDFPAGKGLVVVDDADSPPEVTSVTSSKSPVALAETFVIQGLDETTGTPWHAIVGPPGVSPEPTASPGTASPDPGSSVPPADILIDDDFGPWAEGQPIANGWEIRPADARGELVASGSTPDLRHARLRSETADAIRACKAFAATTEGDLVVDVTIQADAMGETDVIITSVRSGSSETASVRFGQGGTFAYYAGATKVRTSAPNRLERWLRSRVTVHLGTATYDWRLTTTDGTVIVSERGIPFREPVDGASSVCVGTSAGPGRPVVRFDDVRVAH
jgi:hypothetical protein